MIKKPKYNTFLIVLFTLLSVACSSPTDDQVTYTPATDLYSQPMDENAVLQDEQTGMIFAGDQVLVLTKTEFAQKEVLESIAAEQEIEWVGAIPDIGLYQFRTPPLDIPAQEALLDRIRQYPTVEGAFPNYLISNNAQKATCREFGDNHVNLNESIQFENEPINPRCTFLDTGYLDILPIMKAISEWFEFTKVKVAVIDSDFVGLQNQFSNVQYTLLSLMPWSFFQGAEIIPDIETPRGHGFSVAGIIAADDDGVSTSGLLSGLIGSSKIQLFIGASNTVKLFNKKTDKWRLDLDTYHVLELTTRAARDAKADIINLSLGHPCAPLSSRNCTDKYNTWRRIFLGFPNTLFVAGVGNDGHDLEGNEFFPGSMTDYDNLIKVGGYNYCDPLNRHPYSNYSTHPGVVDIAAPYLVPSLNPLDGGLTWIPLGGTSVSTPMVTSLAGVLKSINPKLKPSEIKTIITNFGKIGPEEQGGAALEFSKPILEVLSQQPGLSHEVSQLISRDGTLDPASIILNRICGDCLFVVDKFAPIHVSSENSTANIQEGRDPVVSMFLYNEDGNFSFTLNDYVSFILFESIPVGPDFSVNLTTGGETYTGNGIAGTLFFYSCMVTARNPMTNAPWMVEIDGDFGGQVRWIPLSSNIEETKSTNMAFTLNAQIYDDGTKPFSLYEYVEQHCTLGYEQ